jgi:CheY-like chemotaxis protein
MSNARTQPRLLIVEDNPAYHEIYLQALGRDYELVIAREKEQAKTILRSEMFKVAIIDVRLVEDDKDNRDGLEVAEYMRNDLGHAETRIILITGFPRVDHPSAPPSVGQDKDSVSIERRLEVIECFAVMDKDSDSPIKTLLKHVAEAFS